MFRLTPIRIAAVLLGAVVLYLAGFVAVRSYEQMHRTFMLYVIER